MSSSIPYSQTTRLLFRQEENSRGPISGSSKTGSPDEFSHVLLQVNSRPSAPPPLRMEIVVPLQGPPRDSEIIQVNYKFIKSDFRSVDV